MSMRLDGNTFASVRPIGVLASRKLWGVVAAVFIIASTQGRDLSETVAVQRARRGAARRAGNSARSASDFDFGRSGEG